MRRPATCVDIRKLITIRSICNMKYREEFDGAVDKRKGDGEQHIVTLEESTCTESEPKLDAKAMGSSKA